MIFLNLALPARTCYEPLASTHPDTQGSAAPARGCTFIADERVPRGHGRCACHSPDHLRSPATHNLASVNDNPEWRPNLGRGAERPIRCRVRAARHDFAELRRPGRHTPHAIGDHRRRRRSDDLRGSGVGNADPIPSWRSTAASHHIPCTPSRHRNDHGPRRALRTGQTPPIRNMSAPHNPHQMTRNNPRLASRAMRAYGAACDRTNKEPRHLPAMCPRCG